MFKKKSPRNEPVETTPTPEPVEEVSPWSDGEWSKVIMVTVKTSVMYRDNKSLGEVKVWGCDIKPKNSLGEVNRGIMNAISVMDELKKAGYSVVGNSSAVIMAESTMTWTLEESKK